MDRITIWGTLTVAGQHREALATAQELWQLEPERRSFSWHMVAASYVALGQRDAAIAAMERAEAEDQLWRVRLFSSPALAPLRDHSAFQAAVARVREKIAARNLRPRLLVATPEAAVAPPPLLLDLHGANSDARTALERWRPATRLGWLVAAAQSSQPSSATSFCWDDPDQSRRDLAALLPELPEHCDLVLTGFSQGAAVAIDLAVSGEPVHSRSVVALAAAFGPSWRLPPGDHPVRVKMLTGTADPYLTSGRAAADALRAAGHHVIFEEVRGLGHEFPPDFAERLPALLRAVRP